MSEQEQEGYEPRAPRDLTDKQRLFAQEYLVDLNATQAAIRAGYAANSAAVTGHLNLQAPDIQALIGKVQQKREERTQIKQDRVVKELAALGFSNITHYTVDDTGKVELLAGAPDDAMQAVSSVKRTQRTDRSGATTTTTELKLWDKPAALRLLAQHLGMLVDRLDVTSKGEKLSPQERLSAAVERIQERLGVEEDGTRA